MYITRCTFFLGFIITLLLDLISAAVNSSSTHNYPTSGGLSGGGNGGGYPATGQYPGYPSSRQPSYPPTVSSHIPPVTSSNYYPVGNSGYPKSGGNAGYPSPGGNAGYPSPGGSNTYSPVTASNYYPAGSASYPKPSGSTGYPAPGGSAGYYPQPTGTRNLTTSRNYTTSGGNSYNRTSTGSYNKNPSTGNKQHTYPSTGGNLSGGGSGYPKQTSGGYSKHYYYKPPSKISYIPRKGGAPVSYPVYRGELPNYVYHYKESGSKYGTLLAGLALMNLGSLAASAARTGQTSNQISNNYITQPGEVCKFAVKYTDRNYEESIIDCQIMSSYISQGIQAINSGNVTNMTYYNDVYTSRGDGNITPNPQHIMLPNGTIVTAHTAYEVSQFSPTTVEATGYFHYDMMPNGTLVLNGILPAGSRMPNTVQARNALDIRGEHLKVTKEMACFVIRHTPLWTMRKAVPCRLLQAYADTSLRSVNSATRNGPMFTLLAAIFTVLSYKIIL